MKKIACFFTCGYTESNSLQIFLRKINENIQLRQFCPNKTRKRKCPGAQCDLVDEISGLTGDSLLYYVYEYLSNHQDEFDEFDAIIIEDDLDGRFTEMLVPEDTSSLVSKRTREFEHKCALIQKTIRERLNKDETFPVIQFYAAPEIETWFLSDWDNSFGHVYGPKGLSVLNAAENAFFSSRFHPYVKKHVLFQYNSQMENYGYFCGKYLKLSDQLISSFDSFKVALAEEPYDLARNLSEKNDLRYSKRLHGDEMLKHLSPETVYKKCPVYFQEAFDLLRNL